MSLSISLNYTNNLPTLLQNKSSFGSFAKDGYRLEGSYEADLGWDNLFTDYLENRAAPHRAGATAVDIGAQDGGKPVRLDASKLLFDVETQPGEATE